MNRERTTRGRTRLTGALRVGLLTSVLAVCGLVVPDSSVRQADLAMVRVNRAAGVDLTPDVLWILAVGSDARPGQSMLRTRGDALQLVALNTRTNAASAIGIPRDSWVSIPGVGTNRVNAALYYGGPQAMGQAVGALVGVQVDYVFVTRFKYFENMVDDIGGITVRNPRPFSDPYLRPRAFPAGPVKLNGYGAMAFSRIRKSLPGGDFDRSANQQRTLRGIHAAIRARAAEPGFIERGVASVLRNLHTNLPPGELFKIAHAVAQVEPRRITTCVVRGSVGMAGAASVVFPDVAQARRLGERARADATLESCD